MFALDLPWARSLRRSLALGAALIGAAAATTSTSYGQTTCFPSCQTNDGRFLSLCGTNLESLAGDEIVFSFRVPATATSFNLEIFDGETSGLWDQGTNPIIFEVYADPDNDAQIEVGETAYGPFPGSAMVNNGWSPITIPTSNAARLATSGPYFYIVRAKLQDPSVPNTWSNFKLRANAQILLQTNHFAFTSPLFTAQEAAILYPNFDGTFSPTSLAGSTYDGSWRYFMVVEKAQMFGTRPDTGYVDIWDGDMDFGSFTCAPGQNDLDDGNTPNVPFQPPWTTSTTAVNEGVAVTSQLCRDANGVILPGTTATTTGDPADDNPFVLYRRSPAVTYSIVAPDGAVYANNNPSGSREWERFSVSLSGGVPTIHDYKATALPDGLYEVRINGMDMNNLNSWYSTFRFVGVCESGEPCFTGDECLDCPTCRGVTATKGYWKTHPEAWPVSSLTIGGKSRDKSTLMAWLSSEATDNFYILASQLVASMLNVANGAEDDCISSTISSASAWVGTYENARPIGSGAAWTLGQPLAAKLDNYNNGQLCAPHRDDVECDTPGGKAKGKKAGSGKLK